MRFFLNGVAETAIKGREVFQQVLQLRTASDLSVMTLGKRAANGQALLNLLYRKPYVTAANVEASISVSTPTANALVRDVERLGLLVEFTGQQRGRAYVFRRYLDLFIN